MKYTEEDIIDYIEFLNEDKYQIWLLDYEFNYINDDFICQKFNYRLKKNPDLIYDTYQQLKIKNMDNYFINEKTNNVHV